MRKTTPDYDTGSIRRYTLDVKQTCSSDVMIYYYIIRRPCDYLLLGKQTKCYIVLVFFRERVVQNTE